MKEILLSEIAFFDNIWQTEFNGKFFDLHNDFECYEFKYEDNAIILGFEGIGNSVKLRMFFLESKIVFLNLVTAKEEDHQTIELLYRGRLEKHGNLSDFSDDGSSLIYFEFTSGLSGQFLSKSFTTQTT